MALFKVGLLMQVIHKRKFLSGLAVGISQHEHDGGDESFDSSENDDKSKKVGDESRLNRSKSSTFSERAINASLNLEDQLLES